MLIRGALHIHSTLSHDGQLSLAAVAQLYRSRGLNFVCIAEHSQDMNAEKVATLRRQCRLFSGAEFLMIPGIEYSCANALHIVGVGCDLLLETGDPVRLVHEIRAAGGFAILAHPRRIGWQCAPELCAALNAIEVWNVGYDGKYLPSPPVLEFFNRMKAVNPGLLAAAGDDFHRLGGFYPLSHSMSVAVLERESVLQELIAGRYQIGSLAHWESGASFSPGALAYLRALRIPLNCARTLRERLRSATA